MNGWIRWMRTGAVVVLSAGGIVVLLVWLAGGFGEKIQPGPAQVGVQPLGVAPKVAVELVSVPLSEDAVGARDSLRWHTPCRSFAEASPRATAL